MPPFRRKKSGKSFPVKVCTLDAELEFSLEVSFNSRLVALLLSDILLRNNHAERTVLAVEINGTRFVRLSLPHDRIKGNMVFWTAV